MTSVCDEWGMAGHVAGIGFEGLACSKTCCFVCPTGKEVVMKSLVSKMTVVAAVVAMVLGPGSLADAGWRDSLNKAKEKTRGAVEKTKKVGRGVKDRYKRSERQCDLCGKTIHGRKRCFSCHKKRASEGLNRAKSSVQKKWQDRAKPCSVCGATIHVGSRCRKCFSAAARARGSAVAKKIREESRKRYDSARRVYGGALNKIKDPGTRRKATQAIGTVIKIRNQIKAAKRNATHKGFDALASIPIPGGRTLGDVATERLRKKYPNVADTGAFDDPAATATALVCHDPRFFLNELKLLKGKDGRNVSVRGAIRGSSSLDSSQVISFLKIAEATSDVAYTLQTGEDVSSVASRLGFRVECS